MATFVTTIRFAEQGIKNVRDTTKRQVAFRAAAKKLGVKVTTFLWTLGSLDGVIVYEAPDDETATALMLQTSSLGNVVTQTMRAFSAAEMDKILEKAFPG
jgi:uncharacterized protein with GYD domain